jgi:hypothetical protein
MHMSRDPVGPLLLGLARRCKRPGRAGSTIIGNGRCKFNTWSNQFSKKACLITLQEYTSVNDVVYGALNTVGFWTECCVWQRKSIHIHTSFAAVVQKLFVTRSISAFSHHSRSPGLAPAEFFLSIQGETRAFDGIAVPKHLHHAY